MTQATGEGSNIDGAQLALERMVATARIARMIGDGALEIEATHLAARQHAVILAMWEQARWMRCWDYVVGHVSGGCLPAEACEVRGPVDAFVESHGASTLELRSFWQRTNFLFYNNKPLFDLYRRFGLIGRVRVIEHELMPSLHPRWLDGNASDPCGEDGQPLYDAACTAVHVHARDALRGRRARALPRVRRDQGHGGLALLDTMQLPEIAGPLMLALLERLAEQRPKPARDEPPAPPLDAAPIA